MSRVEKYESIRNFRKVQLLHVYFMIQLNRITPTVLVVGEIFVGSSLFSLIKFHRDLDLFLEVAMFAICSGVAITVKSLVQSTSELSEAMTHYKASFLTLKKLNRLDRRYFRAFQVQTIRVPYLLTITKRTFLTLFHVVLVNVISLIVAFQ
jgi:hypothetical protein